MSTPASKNEKTIICYCAGGLGNRLLPIASCWAIAAETGRQLRILWRDDDIRCQATFSELFSIKMETIFDNEFERLTDCKIYADINDVYKNHYLTGKKSLIHLIEEWGIHDRHHVVQKDDARHLIIYHNSFIEGVDIEMSRRFIGQLNPVPQLQACIDQAACELGISKDVMGVHARGTDFHISVTQYSEKITSVLQERPSQKFLVCSDDPAYENHLKEQFPDNVIIRSKADHVRRGDDRNTWTNNTLTSNAAVKEAIVDIFLLAQTNFKIYHAGSSFASIIQMVRPVRPLALSSMASKPKTVDSPPRQMPTHLQSAYTMNGRIPIDTCYIDESNRSGNLHYAYDFVEKLIHLARNRQSCNYGDTDQWLYAMLERFPIRGKKILIMGSQVPFYEAICIAQGAHPTTVEFQMIHSDHPGISAMTLDELVATPVEFDAGISISTFEHTGLGRYGDPLDPDGDLKAMKLMRRRIKPGGLFFLSVPIGQEAVVWNAHRVYGPARIPLLLDGWDLLDYLGTYENSKTYAKKSYFQPVIVLRNKSMGEKNNCNNDMVNLTYGEGSDKPSDETTKPSISDRGFNAPPQLFNPTVKPSIQIHKSKTRIGYYCPSITFPSAGVRRLIRHVAILNKNGYNATIWHNGEEFTTTDQPRVPMSHLSEKNLNKNDIVVIPEGYPKVMYDLRNSDCRRFAIALNWDYIFTCLPDNLDWRNCNIERVLVASPKIGHMVSWAMGLPVHLINSSVDPELFYKTQADRQPRVVYIQRKAACIDKLKRLLRARCSGFIDDIDWRPLHGLDHVQYASEIRNASLFLNLSTAEGFPTSCIEAMQAGTIVAGFDGVGGQDLLASGKNCFLAPNADYPGIAYILAPFLESLLAGKMDEWQQIITNGLKTAASFTPRAEEISLLKFWDSVK